MTSRIPTRQEYEDRERSELVRLFGDLERLPLAERRENREEWREAMAERPELIADRIGWLFNGSYGWGAQDRARSIVTGKRGNRVAAICQLLSAVEWRCAQGEAIKAWKDLTSAQKDTLDATVTEAIEYYREFLE